jgi:hypothetical protein
MLNARWNRAKSHTGTIPSRTTPHPRFKRRIRGVSDIIGTILILAITVTLFSSIFFFVNSLPGPTAQSTSQFTASTSVSSSGNYLFLNVSYTAGPVLSAGALAFYVVSQANPAALSCHNPFALSDGLPAASSWSAGQIWSLPFSPANLCSGLTSLSANNNNLTLTIVNVAKNVVLFSVTLPGTQVPIPPIFTSQGTLPSPVSGAGPFSLWAQIRDPHLLPTSTVIANLASLPGPVTGSGLPAACNANPPTGCTAPLTYQPSTGTWTSTALSSTASAIGSSFPILITAKDSLGLSNTVTLYAQFVNPQGADLQIAISLNPGTPTVGQNATITALITNKGPGGGVALVNFSASYGKITGATQNVPISPFASNVPVNAYWVAAGPNKGPGRAVITVNATLSGSFASASDTLTVFPRTLLVDGTGIPQGSLNPVDTFTFLTTDFSSAAIPYKVLVAPPNSTTVTFAGKGAAALDNYDVIVWDLGNSSNTCLSPQDAQNLSLAISAMRSVWILGADAFSCGTAAAYKNAFGVTGATALTPPVNPTPLFLKSTIVPVAGITPPNLYLGASTSLTSITLKAGASDYLCLTGSACPTVVASAYNNSRTQGNAFAMPFDLATVSEAVPFSGAVTVSTGQQASIVYDVFDWLANFTTAGTPPTNSRFSDDWAVSQVVVTPTSVSYQTPTDVNLTLRNNGPYSTSLTATLLVNGIPYPQGQPETIQLTPSPLGGSVSGTITWLPAVIGYATVGVEISPPANDSDPGNNILYSSLFNVGIYVHYSVLLVDNTLNVDKSLGLPDDTPTVLNALLAAGFPNSTITQTVLGTSTTACGVVNATLSEFNLIVWNDGENVNTSGVAGCPLDNANANALETFLGNGGARSALLFLGPGILTDTANTVVGTFAQNYLGFTVPATVTQITTTARLYGATGDMVGDGLVLPYVAGGTNDTYCQLTGISSNVVSSPTLYFNAQDFWNPPKSCGIAASDTYSTTAAWHSAYWAFDAATASNAQPSLLNYSLLTLRSATFFGRLLPGTDAVIGPPDVTFATTVAPWTNFDGMNPEIDQQYLIRANVTNLGGGTAADVGVSVYDGVHILGSQTLTIGGSSSGPQGNTSLAQGQISIPWTPLYAGLNPITVELTSGVSGNIIPGAATTATWNVNVYFFYDPTTSNAHQWTHDDLALWQDPENPMDLNCMMNNYTGIEGECTSAAAPFNGGYCMTTSISPSVSYYTDDQSLSQMWPQAVSAVKNQGTCSYTSTDGKDKWGMVSAYPPSSNACYEYNQYCASLGIKDDEANQNSVKWAYSSTVTTPATASSAIASWYQQYDLSLSLTGGILCVVPATSTCPNTLTGSSIPTPDPGYPGTIVYNSCTNVIPAFTGVSNGWQQEQLNISLSPSMKTGNFYEFRIGFGYVEGDGNGCSSGSPIGTGWQIDQLKVRVSSPNTVQPALPLHMGCTNLGYGIQIPNSCAGQTPGNDTSPDYWHIENAATLASQGISGTPFPGAWVDAGTYTSPYCPNGGTCLSFGPNMWDSLYSPPIDLVNAISASLVFNYVFSRQVGAMDPSMAFVVQISPDLSSGQRVWSQVFSAEQQNDVTSWDLGWWHNVTISLNSFVGQVVVIRFLTITSGGSDCGCDTPAAFPTEDQNYGINPTSNCVGSCYGESAAVLSGVFVAGNTSISSTGAVINPHSAYPRHSLDTLTSTIGTRESPEDSQYIIQTFKHQVFIRQALLQSASLVGQTSCLGPSPDTLREGLSSLDYDPLGCFSTITGQSTSLPDPSGGQAAAPAPQTTLSDPRPTRSLN